MGNNSSNQNSQVNSNSYQPNNYNFQSESENIFVSNSQFNDDEPIDQDFKKQAQKVNKQTYNLDKGLTLEVKSLQKYFKFNEKDVQTIPVMVSVKTLDKTEQNTEEKHKSVKNTESNRPSVDLICVIDNSGSMSGEKIENVKKTLNYLLELLGENDRISLITFNSSSTRLCKLLKINKQNISTLKSIISNINANGGTCINSGMEIAFRMLKERAFTNQVSSIFLLSDGQDGSAEIAVKNSLNRLLPQECFTIHSFGFGSDHDGPLMTKLCQLKDGNFYYVEKIKQVDEFFVDALGGLFSIVAQEVEIDIRVDLQEANKKFFSESFVSKTYGEMWSVVKVNQAYKIKINQLFSGVSKDFIFEITVPAKKLSELQDFERNAEIVKATVSAIPIDPVYSTKVVMENKLILTLFTNQEQIAEDSEVNDNVEFNYLRVKASEAMEQAMQQAEKKQYQNGQVILQHMIERCDISHPKNKEKVQILKKELADCQQNAKANVYEQEGKFKVLTKMHANIQQKSQAVESADLYQNCVQREMVSKAKSNKGGFF